MPRGSVNADVPKLVRTWLLWDTLWIIVGLLWFAYCVLYIMLFLANVSQKDVDRWLITLATHFTSKWILAPLAATVLWVLLIKFIDFSAENFIEDRFDEFVRAVGRDGGSRAGGRAPGGASA